MTKEKVLNFHQILHEKLNYTCQDHHDHATAATTTSGSHDNNCDKHETASRVSEVFFELANASVVEYTIDPNHDHHHPPQEQKASKKPNIITNLTLYQNSQHNQHTGGIIWETSYLLTEYFMHHHHHYYQKKPQPQRLGRVLEVGAGCGGLVGMALACRQNYATEVVLTEVPEVLTLLERNVSVNAGNFRVPLHCCCLDWTDTTFACDDDNNNSTNNNTILSPHSFDTIVGTDILFAPSLVEPLLRTLCRMSKPSTRIYICVQRRCSTSHDLFLQKAKLWFHIQDVTREVLSLCSSSDHDDDDDDDEDDDSNSSRGGGVSLSWGLSLECFLFLLTVRT